MQQSEQTTHEQIAVSSLFLLLPQEVSRESKINPTVARNRVLPKTKPSFKLTVPKRKNFKPKRVEI